MEKRNAGKTLKDIAKATQLSISTVSQILNNKPSNFSSEATKMKVKAIAQAVGYRPNIGYKIMMGAKTNTSAILIAISAVGTDEHIQKLILLLSEKLRIKGYSTYICTLDTNENKNISMVEDLIYRGAEHFIVIGAPFGYETIQELFKMHAKTYIAYNSLLDRCINADVVPGVEALLRFFLSENRTNFKMILPDPVKDKFSGDRFMALKNIFSTLGNEELLDKYIAPVENPLELSPEFEKYAFEQGYEATRNIIGKAPSVQALLYQNDYFALGGVKYLIEKGYRIGKEIAIAGFNNIYAVKYNPFPISSIEHNIENISDMLIREMFNKTPFQAKEKLEVCIRK